jgi:hypothetical protein
MKRYVTTVLMTVAVGLFLMGGWMVNHAEAQIVPFDVARICMQNEFRQRIDLRTYSASDSGPAGVWLANGIYDLGFSCQGTRYWPVHGAITAKVSPKDFKAIARTGTLFRIDFEAGGIDLTLPGCVKFKEGLTCTVRRADPDSGADLDAEHKEPEVTCRGAFTNIGFTTVFTANDAWSPIPCFVDPEGYMDEQAPPALSTGDPMPGQASR